MKAISLFSGPGGACEGLRRAGFNVVGIEMEDSAVATARAAGHRAIHSDVRADSPEGFMRTAFAGGRLDLLQASPPCQGLSRAGTGAGRDDLELLLHSIDKVASQPTYLQEHEADLRMDLLVKRCADERSPLTFEVVRWIVSLKPRMVMLEQVPAALPIWEAIADLLRSLGYEAWAGFVHAEQFGVPQTRKRAMLLAGHGVEGDLAPIPTHSKYHSRSPERIDEGVQRWVSMAEALGWGVDELVGFPRKADDKGGVIHIDGTAYRKRDLRESGKPSQVVTEKARSWERYMPTHFGDVVNRNGSIRPIDAPSPAITASADNGNFRFIDRDDHSDYLEGRGAYARIDRQALRKAVEPRVNNQSGTEFDLGWPMDRPSPVVAGRGLVTMLGANANRFNGATKSRNDGIRVSVQEAGILQSFPADYPWQGTRTQQFQQVGNAVPPHLQHSLTIHLLQCVSEMPDTTETQLGA